MTHVQVTLDHYKNQLFHITMITINELIGLMPQWLGKEATVLPIFGGITNRNFKILIDDVPFFVSISGHNTHLLDVNWYNKSYNARICGEAGISPKLIRRFSQQKALVFQFLSLPLCTIESLNTSAVQQRLVNSLKVLHCGGKFKQDFDMFSLIKLYMGNIEKLNLKLPPEYGKFKKTIWAIGEVLAPYRDILVPCHNDLVPENMMDDGVFVFLYDFDYSGNNDPCFDLGSVSIEAGYDDMQVRDLACAYWGFDSEQIVARIQLHGIMGAVGWSLWSVIQATVSDIDFDFETYVLHRWNQALERMESDAFDEWLRLVTK